MKTIDAILIQDEETYGTYIKFEDIIGDGTVLISFVENDKPIKLHISIHVAGLLKWLKAHYEENKDDSNLS